MTNNQLGLTNTEQTSSDKSNIRRDLMNPELIVNESPENKPTSGTNPILNALVSMYHRLTDKEPMASMLYEMVFEDIKSGAYRAEVEAIQALPKGPEQQAMKLGKLPAFTPSIEVEGARKKENDHKHTGVISLDIDQDNIELSSVVSTAQEVKDLLASMDEVAAVYISPSGVGVKGFVLVDPVPVNDQEHKDAFRAVDEFIRAKGLTMDQQTSDITRPCYVGDDPDIYVAKGPVVKIAWSKGSVAGLPAVDTDSEEEYGGVYSNELVNAIRAAVDGFVLAAERKGLVPGTDEYINNKLLRVQGALETILPKAKTMPFLGEVLMTGKTNSLPDGWGPKVYKDRSAWAYCFAGWMYRAGADQEQVLGVFLQPSYGINDTFFDPMKRHNIDRQQRRAVGRPWLEHQKYQSSRPGDEVFDHLEDKYSEADLSDLRTGYASKKQPSPFSVATDLLEEGIDEGDIREAMTNLFPESDVMRLDKSVTKAVKNEETAQSAMEQAVALLNQACFKIMRVGKNTAVATIEEDGSMTLQTFAAFRESLNDEKVWINAKKFKRLGDVYMDSDLARKYERAEFDPSAPLGERPYGYGERKGLALNLYSGPGIEPVAGDTSIIHRWLCDDICGNHMPSYEALVLFLANLAHYPGRTGEMCVVLKGNEGTGKTYFAETFLGMLVGEEHYILDRNPFGTFNGHTERAIVINLDDAGFQPENQNALRSMITAGKRSVERKGFDKKLIPNALRFVITTNEEVIIDADSEARRFLVIEVTDNRKGDKAFYAELTEHLKNGGMAALLHELLAMKDVPIKMPDAPLTDALAEQRQESLPTFTRWWQEYLGKASPGGDADTTLAQVDVDTLWKDMSYFYTDCKTREAVPDRTRMSKLLSRLVTKETRRRKELGKKVAYFVFPSLKRAREEYEEAVRLKIDWAGIYGEDV